MAIPARRPDEPEPINLRCPQRRFHEFEYVVRPMHDGRVNPAHAIWQHIVCRHCYASFHESRMSATLMNMAAQANTRDQLHIIYRIPTPEELLLASK